MFLFIGSTSYGSSLNLSGESFILIEEESGRILAEKTPHQKLPIASTTKIMTALLAVESGKLDDIVEISRDSVGVEGSSIFLKEGEKIKLRDLVYGLMLRSGNDSAVAIATYLGGTEENFISYMNKKARLIGAMNTNFMNPHGLHDENHYSTAYDLALITKTAFKNKDFEEIAAAKSYRSDRDEYNYYVNKNKTLWEYDGGDGVKIGYTMRAGRCLVSSAKRNNMRLIAVSLNDPNWFNDNYALFDYGFNNYKLYRVYERNQLLKTIDVKNGKKDKVVLVSEKDFLYPLKEEEISLLKVNIQLDESTNAPIDKGQLLGHVEVFLDGKLIRRDNLVAKESVERMNMLERLIRTLNGRVADDVVYKSHKKG